MILASTAKGSNVQELAEMDDSVMKVILPSIAMVATSHSTEFEELKTEVENLRRQLSDIQATGRHRSNRRTQS